MSAATELAQEHALRVAAEGNARAVLAAMRDLVAAQESAIAARVSEILAELETAAAPVSASALDVALGESARLRAEMATLRGEFALTHAAASVGVRASYLSSVVKLYRGHFTLLDDGTPLTRDTMSQDVARYFADTVYRELPELFDEHDYRRLLAIRGT